MKDDLDPTCYHCGESPPHAISECPACMSDEETRAAYLVCRKALRELLDGCDPVLGTYLRTLTADHIARHALTFRPTRSAP